MQRLKAKKTVGGGGGGGGGEQTKTQAGNARNVEIQAENG